MQRSLQSFVCYKHLSLDHTHKLKSFLEKHSTKEGSWARFTLTRGNIRFHFVNEHNQILSTHELDAQNTTVLIPPSSLHKIESITAAYAFSLDSLCLPHRYISKKYQMSNVHRDLLYAWQTCLQPQAPIKILDVGRGSGRNLLYFTHLGHEVVGIDINAQALEKIDTIAKNESFNHVKLFEHDLNSGLPPKLTSTFDLVVSTVSLQFLDSDRAYPLLAQLQNITAPNGYHIIVFPTQCRALCIAQEFHLFTQSK